jgi:hypothetical protein
MAGDNGVPVEAGMRIDLFDPKQHGRGRGHPSVVVPFNGGSFEVDGIQIEMRPNVEWDRDSYDWRGYERINELADQVHRDGGFGWSGDEIHIGDEILVGRDVVKLLAELNRRYGARVDAAGKPDLDAAYQQGFDAALRQVEKAIAGLGR